MRDAITRSAGIGQSGFRHPGALRLRRFGRRYCLGRLKSRRQRHAPCISVVWLLAYTRRMGDPGMSARHAQKEVVVKSVILAVTATSAIAASLAVFAQSDAQSPVTRAQVRAELQQLEQAGYRPSGEDPNYPQDIQAAEARAAARNGSTAYGGVLSGSSASGSSTTGLPSAPASQVYDY